VSAWTLAIPAPALWLSANDRRRSIAQASKVTAWRDAGHQYARAVGLPRGLEHVHITATVRHTASRYDAGNLYPTAKAVVDGLVDYGLVPDDDNKHVTGPDMRSGQKWPKPKYGPVGMLIVTVRQAVPGACPACGTQTTAAAGGTRATVPGEPAAAVPNPAVT
jgi:crossover junction endodeoxyribonuclease RusA